MVKPDRSAPGCSNCGFDVELAFDIHAICSSPREADLIEYVNPHRRNPEKQ